MPSGRFGSVLAMKLNTFVALSAAELACIAGMQTNPVKLRRGRQLTHEGDTGHKAFVLQQGWACSFKLLANGSRQIISANGNSATAAIGSPGGAIRPTLVHEAAVSRLGRVSVGGVQFSSRSKTKR